MKRISLAMVLIAAAGCGSREAAPEDTPKRRVWREPPNLVRIQGTITLDDKPLPGGMVMFLPEKQDQGRPASGPVEGNGTFTLGTVDAGDGIVPGRYRVVVTDTKSLPASTTIPSRYMDPEKTPLGVTVEKDGQQVRLNMNP